MLLQGRVLELLKIESSLPGVAIVAIVAVLLDAGVKVERLGDNRCPTKTRNDPCNDIAYYHEVRLMIGVPGAICQPNFDSNTQGRRVETR